MIELIEMIYLKLKYNKMKKTLLITCLIFVTLNITHAQQFQKENTKLNKHGFYHDYHAKIMDNGEDLIDQSRFRPTNLERSEIPFFLIEREHFRTSRYGLSYMDERHYRRIKLTRIKYFKSRSELKIEDWMADEDYWQTDDSINPIFDEEDRELGFEYWMVDEKYWQENNSVNPIMEEKDKELSFQEWMIDPLFWEN
jgi:hypothetical protein